MPAPRPAPAAPPAPTAARAPTAAPAATTAATTWFQPPEPGADVPPVLLLPGRVIDGAFAFSAPPGPMPTTLPLLHVHRLAPR